MGEMSDRKAASTHDGHLGYTDALKNIQLYLSVISIHIFFTIRLEREKYYKHATKARNNSKKYMSIILDGEFI